MFIAEMTIKDVPPFSGEVDFKFDKRVNVFIGPNASGKSTLLEHLLRSYNNTGTSDPELSYIDGQPVHLVRSEDCAFVLEDDDDTYDHQSEIWNIIIIPATRVPYHFYHDDIVTGSDEKVFYGSSHISGLLYESDIHNTISALYRIIEGKPTDDMRLTRDMPIEEIWEHDFTLERAKEDTQKAGRGLNEALSVSHSCAKDICREIVRGNAPLNKQTVMEVTSESGLPTLDARLELAVRVQTNDRGGSALDMTSLSAGTEGTLWWTRLIALSLLFMHKFETGWQKRRAILLIDEIENHLHPTWQRRVIPALLDHFPGLQIFATTHSPFVVAGLKKGQVHLLNRDENGVVSTTTNQQDIIGWTADEILRVYMGVGEPTDERTANAGAELRRLRDMGTLADEREEEQRQARIRELREIVNIAVLDGPRAAEDARFTENLTRILERYRLSRDLNQENG